MSTLPFQARRRFVAVASVATASIAAPASVHGQAVKGYPAKPVRLIVPFPPGGGAEMLGRIIASQLSVNLNQKVSVECIAGLGSILGTESVSKAPADGYTMLLAGMGSIVSPPLLYREPPYTMANFAPVTLVARFPVVLLVSPLLTSATSLQDLIGEIRRARGNVTYGSVGAGSPHHLTMEMLLQRTGTRMVHVPFKGTAAAVKELEAGHVMAMFCELSSVRSQIQSGRLRAIAVAATNRIATLPDLPTLHEQGTPDVVASGWQALFMPAGAKQDIVAKVQAAHGTAMDNPEMLKQLSEVGCDPASCTPEELEDLLRSETDRWKRVIRDSNLHLD